MLNLIVPWSNALNNRDALKHRAKQKRLPKNTSLLYDPTWKVLTGIPYILRIGMECDSFLIPENQRAPFHRNVNVLDLWMTLLRMPYDIRVSNT